MRIDHSRVYSDEEIENAMATVARVIELYGDAYWPILERLERELTDRRAKASCLNSHLRTFHKRKPLQNWQAHLGAVNHKS
mgnify:CR=1 FL=1|jgi:hypothetical protein